MATAETPVSMAMAETMADLKSYEQAFRDLDEDGDGKLTLEELHTVLEQQGQTWTHEQLQHMVELVDHNSNGTVEMSEFLELMNAGPMLLEQQEMMEAFKIFDPKGKGYVSVRTLRLILTKLGSNPLSEGVGELIKFSDGNGDGKVYYADVVRRIYDGL